MRISVACSWIFCLVYGEEAASHWILIYLTYLLECAFVLINNWWYSSWIRACLRYICISLACFRQLIKWKMQINRAQQQFDYAMYQSKYVNRAPHQSRIQLVKLEILRINEIFCPFLMSCLIRHSSKFCQISNESKGFECLMASWLRYHENTHMCSKLELPMLRRIIILSWHFDPPLSDNQLNGYAVHISMWLGPRFEIN